MMTANEIRSKYLKFFESKGHAVIPAAPVVQENDPTTLFTPFGMQQMVPYLKGEPHPMGTRIVNSQPCFRADDIEEVGDNRHITFFEMLGNWSLGDYFKKEQLPWIFEFITSEVGLDPTRLFVTLFEGDKSVPRDDESVKIWQELFQSTESAKSGVEGFNEKTKIYLYPAKKNWWSRVGVPENMPAGEIGGPDSEMFYDFGADLHLHENSPWKDEPCHVNCDCGRFLEIGNSVFMQYIKQDDGSFEPLPKQNVDFGGGLERITAAANNDPDVFKIDLFWPIINQLVLHTNKPYEGENQAPMRIIADHLRAATFMIAQGLVPGNKQQGYFLRRLLRRAAIKAKKLNDTIKPEALFKEIADILFFKYKDTYFTEVDDALVSQVVKEEMDRFNHTLTKGLRQFDKYDHIDGKVAFDLLQTYGFPWELTLEMATEKGQTVDRSQFEAEFKKHQDLSRTASAGMFKGGLADHSEATTKYHTATHLLHKALRTVLGDHVQQLGSNITSERLRFDFKHPDKLTPEQLKQVEDLVNEKIAADLPVHHTTEDKDAALGAGAMAFFREKYPDKVSVYTIGNNPDSDWWSKELCGGPHVSSTGHIGPVTIKKEESVGAGTRRIYMVFRQ